MADWKWWPWSEDDTNPEPTYAPQPTYAAASDESQWDQLGYWGALNGQSPDQYAQTLASTPVVQAPAANYAAGGGGEAPWNEWGYLGQAEGRVTGAAAQNQDAIGKLGWQNFQTSVGNQAALDRVGSAITGQDAANAKYIGDSRGLVDQLGGYRDQANGYDWSNLAGYQSELSGIRSENDAYMGTLGGAYNSMSTPLTSSLTPNYLTSQAAQAYADPASIAAQNQALGFLQGGMNGSLDYVSQGASTYANAADVAAQQNAAGVLQGIGQGSMDVDFDSLPGIGDLRDVYKNGAFDVHVGQEDPAAYGAMQEALGKYKALTDPRVTDAERFLYEKARQEQEQDERANRSAVLTNLRQRGLSGSSAEVADAAIGSQRASQNRLLSDLGAGSIAVQRSMEALEGYGSLSSTMSAQANDLAKSNASNRLEALGQYTGIGANVQTGNMNRRAQGAADASSAYGEIRRQGFSEAAFRAESADTASRANQQTRLQSGIAAGDLASTQRSQSFDESFKRGAAADQTNQFNESNRIDITKYNQDYAQKERDAAWGRTTDYANTGLRASELNSLNSTRKYEAGQKTNADTYGRNRDVLTATDTVNTRENTLGNQQTDRRIGAEGLAIDNNNSFYNRSAGITGLDIANRNATTSGLVGIDFARGGVTQRNLDAEAARVVALNAENKADKRAKDAIWFEAGKHATVPGYGVL